MSFIRVDPLPTYIFAASVGFSPDVPLSYACLMQAHTGREHALEQQCLELQGLVEQREGEWRQREAGLQQAIRDKEELIQRYLTDLSVEEVGHVYLVSLSDRSR